MRTPTDRNDVPARWFSKEHMSGTFLVGASLCIAGLLRCWNITSHGFDNLYYSPAALSMASSWHNFFFAAFDQAGFLAIGKPPFAFWMQALNVRLFGFNALTVHIPQVIAGMTSVLLVFLLARRLMDTKSAGLAALIAAITPASVAADRSNLADSWLLLLLLGATVLSLSASDTGNAKGLCFGAALLGLGFLTKFMAAYLAIPAVFLTYALTAPVPLRRRLAHVGPASIVVVLTSLFWPVAVDLTPPERRPYIAETDNNSVLSLAFGYQGIGRILTRAMPENGDGKPTPDPQPKRHIPSPNPPKGFVPPPHIITGHGGAPGLLRLANRDMAGHITWFMPVVFVGALATLLHKSKTGDALKPRRDVLFWSLWFGTFAAVFSLAPTFIHPYYLTLLTPAVAILTALTFRYLWKTLDDGRSPIFPMIAVALTLLWHMRLLAFYPPWAYPLVPALSAITVNSFVGLLVARTPRIRKYALCLAGVAAFLCPTLWATTPALAPTGRMVPIADPTLLDYRKTVATEGAKTTHIPSLVRFLGENHQEEQFILAVRDIHWAAPIILATNQPVMAFGGYHGHEKTLDVQDFVQRVSSGEVRYVLLATNINMVQMAGPSRPFPPKNDIEEWVKNHATLVPPEMWQSPNVRTRNVPSPMPMWGPIDQMIALMYAESSLELYDCAVSRN